MASRRARLAVLVPHGLHTDSRSRKIALAAAREGWKVTIIGFGGPRLPRRARLGPVSVIRVPVEKRMREAEELRRRRHGAGAVLQAGLQHRGAHDLWNAAYRERQRLRRDRLAERALQGTATGVPALWWRGVSYLDRITHEARERLYLAQEERRPDLERAEGDWSRDLPWLLDIDLAVAPVLERLKPDVIHAEGLPMLPTAALTAARLRHSGHAVALVADALQHAGGTAWDTEREAAGYVSAERRFLPRADVVTVPSPELGAELGAAYALRTSPLVVRNAPVAERLLDEAGDLREEVGLEPSVPLLVCLAGGDAGRGAGTAVKALELLPDVHLAIVGDPHAPRILRVLRTAQRRAVAERVHILRFDSEIGLAHYIRSADVGLILRERTRESSVPVPAELATMVHAGLPVVATDTPGLAGFVLDHDLGAVYAGEDEDSFRHAAQAMLDRATTRTTTVGETAPALVSELTWEHQVRPLLDRYADISGVRPDGMDGVNGANGVDWHVVEEAVLPGRSRDGSHRPTGQTERDLPWRELGVTKVRLGLGIANYAGQLSALAQAVTERRDDVSAEVTTRSTGGDFGYPSDVYLPAAELSQLDGQLEQVRRVLLRYTHLIADAFLPVFGSLNGSDIAADLPMLQQAGVHVALLAHGSEVRHPGRHRERLPFSHFHDAEPHVVRNLTRVAERNREIAETSGRPVFVTTPDLLDDLPMATWVPLVVDLDAWACDTEPLTRPRPVVLHAPSKRWTKGTDHFLPDLEALHDRGVIELRLVEGVPWTQMRAAVQDADIIVDQVAVGSYGTFACEAMAAGKPVIVHLTPTVVSALGGDPPMLNARADEVGAAIERLLDDRAYGVELGRRASAYVRQVHGGARSAEALAAFLAH